MFTPDEALQRLADGNRRYVAGRSASDPATLPARRAALVDGQAPFAAVLGCADSRVPVEAVFDQGPGDLFVVRVAGHVATSAPVGSLEFAANKLGARLIVVLGHARCGAVEAALGNPRGLSRELQAVVDAIRPALDGLPDAEGADRLAGAVNAHVRATVAALRATPALATLISDEGLRIVGAEYALDSGTVTFLDA